MFYTYRSVSLLAFILLVFAACEKDPTPLPPAVDAPFIVHIDNEYNDLQAQYAVFLSDVDGKVRAFRWLPGSDTAQLQVTDARTSDRLDCTIVRLTTVQAQGSGDTSLSVQTYTQLASGQTIHLRSPIYQQTTNLQLDLTNLSSLDTIIVSDGLTFSRPQPNNNFSGLYQVQHTGRMWVRLKVNGEPNWRFLLLDNVSGETLAVTVDVSLLPSLLTAPKSITLPFTAPWKYKIEGVVDTATRQYLALGDLLRSPGGFTPIFGELAVYEPIVKPYQGYRMMVAGSNIAPGGYTYASDGYYADVPGSLPLPSFDLEPTTAASNRFIAVKCVGNFDLLALARTRTGNPNISWEVFIQPVNGILSYRLPDIPTTLAQRFSALKNYDFGNSVVVRAENYERLEGYEAVVKKLLSNDDPYWRAKAGYLSREEVQ